MIKYFKEDGKNQENITLPKEHNNFLVTDTKEIDIYNWPEKEFKLISLRNLIT